MAKRDKLKVTALSDRKNSQPLPPATDADFLEHFRSTYRFMGHPFESFLPAYRYGEERGDSFLAGRNWTEIEDDVHREWELSHPGTWKRYREAIRYGCQRTMNT